MKNPVISEPIFEEVEAPVYTIKECNDIVSVIANCMSDIHMHHSAISDIEEYIDRFPFIHKETKDHILDVITAHLVING